MSDTATRRDASGSEPTLGAFPQQYADFPRSSNVNLQPLREQGWAAFQQLGFPSRKVEAWKYTDTRGISRGTFEPVSQLSSVEIGAESSLDIDAYRLVFVDGVFDPEASALGDLPEGVQLAPLSHRIEDNAALPEGFAGLLGADAGPFSALNLAFAGEGVVLTVGRNVELDKPVYVHFYSTAQAQPVMSHPRLLIRLEDNARAKVIEHFNGDSDAKNFTNVVGEGYLAAGARLDVYKLNEAAEQEFHVANFKLEQDRDSHFVSHNLTLGGGLTRNDLDTELNGTNAQTEYWGLFFVNGRQHVDNHTVVNHNVAKTFSNENYKGIMNDRGHGVFNGRVYIKQDAQEVRGYQNNANLLLSDKAEIDTKPELEIYADDVLCSHGATTGQLDEEAVFALRARGIDEEKARALLTLAFAGEVLEATEIPAISQRVERRVAGMLPDRFDLEDLVEFAQ